MNLNIPLLESHSIEYKSFAIFLIWIFPSLGGFLFGYDIGITSFVIDQLQSNKSAVSWSNYINKSNTLTSLLISSSIGGALIGVLLIFKLSDYFGRKKELIISSFLYLIGSIIQVSSKYFDNLYGLVIFIIGRYIYGLGIGFTMHCAPAYIAEMSPETIRGFLVSLKEVFIVLGILIGYIIGYLFKNINAGWQYVCGINMIFSMIMGIGICFLPDSCRWLALTGNFKDSKKSIQFFIKFNSVEKITNEIFIECEKIKNSEKAINWYKKYYFQLFVGIGIITFQQITGQPSVLYYAEKIFNDAGINSFATILTGIWKLITTLSTCFVVDRFGRRKFLLIGITIMSLALGILTYCYYILEPNTIELNNIKIFIIVSIFLYIGGYQIGFGPISWLLISEIFPLEVRGEAVAISVFANFFWNLIITFTFGIETKYIGSFNTFLIYFILNLLALLFVYKFLPETKGLSLENISKVFLKNKFYNLV